MTLFNRHEARAKRQQVIDALLAEPDTPYKVIAARLGVQAIYVAQVKCDLKYRGGRPRSWTDRTPSSAYTVEHCKTRKSPWFIDPHGCPTRVLTGVVVEKRAPLKFNMLEDV